ncbi:polysaccharide biosynthesis protein [Maribacter confluentis]|uniref:Polysaccharide biosynthesis protein n=1 Tax=Maribacter confluentis TaxID=1656093 RepID=A0ABT8RTF7_9FLAO|nr:polysaccharide biosynthesis protein [Maribacter confluentis]MDO1513692.1 polysaccharide biosynthesis protein [Maribacter confluentis]
MNKLLGMLTKKKDELPRFISVVLDQGLMSVITLLTTIILVRTYNQYDYAELVLLFSIALFVLGFQSAIISKPYAISLNDFSLNEDKGYFHFNLFLKFVFTFLLCFVFPLFYYFSFEKWNIKKFAFFLIYLIAHSSYFFVRETLLSERKTKQNLIYGLFCFIGLAVLLALIYFLKLREITFFLGAASFIYLAITVVYLVSEISKHTVVWKQYINYWNVNWKIGKWLLGGNFLFHLSSNIYPWFLLYLSTKDNIAVFAVLMSVAGLINPILTALSSYLLPIFVRTNDNFKKVRALTKRWQIVFGIMALALVIIGTVLGQNIISLLYGEKYNNLGLLIIYPFIYQAINIIFQPNKIALNAVKRTDVGFFILIPRSIIAVVLGYFLIKNYGLHGVFYTMIIENFIYQCIYYFIYRRIFA